MDCGGGKWELTADHSPLFSVIVPVYNGERYLKECVESILRQSFEDFELIIADDASTDGSVKIAESFDEPRIHILRQKANVGMFTNLNRAAASAKGRLLRFVCQDDMLEKDCLSLEADLFDRAPSIAMAFCKMTSIDDNGVVVDKAELSDLPEVLSPVSCQQHFFFHECIPGNLSAVTVRRTCFEECGGFNPTFRLTADFELWVRLCEKRPMGVLRRHAARLRWHPDQQSRQLESLPHIVRERRAIRKRVLNHLPDGMLDSCRRFQRWRLNVVDVNAAIHAAARGRFSLAWRIAKVIGWSDFVAGFAHWLATINNRLYFPRYAIQDDL